MAALSLSALLTAVALLAAGPTVVDPVALEAAVEAEPERPGLRLALALALLEAGRVDAAERHARTVVSAWPRSVRAHWLLARIAILRGDRAAAEGHLEALSTHGGERARRAVEQLRPALPVAVGPAVSTRARARVAVEYDSGVERLPDDIPSGRGDRPAALRATLGVEATPQAVRGRLRGEARLAAERSAHLGSTTAVGDADRTSLAFRLRGAREGDVVHFGAFGEGGALLAGRDPLPALASYGGGAWVGGAPGRFSPWLEGRALRFELAERATAGSDGLWAFEGALGAASLVSGQRIAGRLVLRALAPDLPESAHEWGGDLAYTGGRGRFSGHALVGLFQRSSERGIDGLHGRTELRGRFALTASVGTGLTGQLRAGAVERGPRVIAGVFLEVVP
ncbi:hypothetical protein L6V77_10605 [Myxococcota bacterium]|nr:hypothetical protein [Myxococcota bacterium]